MANLSLPNPFFDGMSSTSGSSKDSMFVKFNVGGEIFQTSKETILSEPDTLFHHILSDSWHASKDLEGAILLDRDPK